MKKKANIVALGGVLSAIAVLTLFAVSYIPTGRASMYALASFYTAFIVASGGKKHGVIFFAATSILSWILIPHKPALIPYIGFFGWYGVLKAAIEGIGKKPIQWALKLLTVNVVAVVGAIVYYMCFNAFDYKNIWFPAIVLLAQPVFVLYDYLFTVIIDMFERRFQRRFD